MQCREHQARSYNTPRQLNYNCTSTAGSRQHRTHKQRSPATRANMLSLNTVQPWVTRILSEPSVPQVPSPSIVKNQRHSVGELLCPTVFTCNLHASVLKGTSSFALATCSRFPLSPPLLCRGFVCAIGDCTLHLRGHVKIP